LCSFGAAVRRLRRGELSKISDVATGHDKHHQFKDPVRSAPHSAADFSHLGKGVVGFSINFSL